MLLRGCFVPKAVLNTLNRYLLQNGHLQVNMDFPFWRGIWI